MHQARRAPPPPSSVTRLAVIVLFFLSGACGLIYEVVWMRMLTLVFGATAFATATILAAFFAGLALGSFYFGQVADRARSTLRAYALLEGGVGVFAFLMPFILDALTGVFVAASRHLALGYYGLSALRFALSFLVLMIPATLMGGTLPVVVRFFTTADGRVGWNVGRLYAVNTFGAVVGTVSAGFFLILLLGVRETTYVAGAVNLAIALAVLSMARHLDAEAPDAMGRPGEETEAEAGLPIGVAAPPTSGSTDATPTVPMARLVLWAVGISGFCALALEVLWTRALVFFLDNSTHAFTTMLTAFLLGIAIGGALIARFVDSGRALLARLGVILVLVGLTAAVAIPVLSHSTPVLQTMARVRPDAMLAWKWMGMRFAVSLAVMLVPTVLMGMTLPLAARICTGRPEGVGTALGSVYASNTLGGVLGSVAAGFLLIPALGLRDGILLVAAAQVVLGGILVLAQPGLGLGRTARLATGAGLTAAAAVAVLLLRGAMTLTSYVERLDSAEVLSYREGVGATVKVFSDTLGARYLSIDGFPVAGTSLGLLDAQGALSNLPMLLSDVPGARVNLVGFGAGGASWGVLQYGASRVDCVELVPDVPAAARWFPDVNHGVLHDPRFNLILGDGRNYALVNDHTYDVISIDATSPKMAGNGSLYTLEFYRLLKARLSDDGLVVQWLPIHLLSDAEVRMTANTFMKVFPHTTLWLSALRHHGILVGTSKKLKIDYTALGAKLARPGVRDELSPLKVNGPLDVTGGFVMGEERLATYVAGARVNTDDHPYLEFTPAMAYFLSTKYLVENLVNFRRYRESPVSLLVDTGDTDQERATVAGEVQRRFEATQHSIGGDIYFYLGMTAQAGIEYGTALKIDPSEKNWANPVWLGASGGASSPKVRSP